MQKSAKFDCRSSFDDPALPKLLARQVDVIAPHNPEFIGVDLNARKERFAFEPFERLEATRKEARMITLAEIAFVGRFGKLCPARREQLRVEIVCNP